MNNKILIIAIIIFIILLIGILLIVFLAPQEKGSPCLCAGDSMNCDDFTTQAEAQECFEFCGGSERDVHRLDADGNGLACEILP